MTEVRPFKDRSDRMFGRERDIQALQQRVRFKGLTAVVARPQMGKSWLLTELARRLACEHNPPYAVGFAESFGQTPDLLARAVADLYTRWLSDAGMAGQARMVWKQQKGNLLGGVAGTVSKIFFEVFGEVAKPVATAVDEAINGLVAANKTLTSGGLQLPTLQYEQARELVAAVAKISGRPVVLFLDQWERSPDAKLESRTLEAFLHHLNDWPAYHIFLALRPDEPTNGIIEDLAESLPGAAQIYPLELLDLEDAAAHGRLLNFLNWQVPAARGVPAAQILASIDGYPGVIYQWTSDYQREAMHSAEDLERVAADAHEYRFGELDTLLKALQADARRLAARLALLPLAASEAWPEIKLQVLDGLDEELLDDLKLMKVLERAEPPSLGHTKRWDAARAWFVKNNTVATRNQAEALVCGLAVKIDKMSGEFNFPALALCALRESCGELNASALARGLCEAATSMFMKQVNHDLILDGARSASHASSVSGARLIANGLVNAYDDALANNNMERADAILSQLRGHAKTHLENATVAVGPALALLNGMSRGKLRLKNELLDELRALINEYGKEASIRESLARALMAAVCVTRTSIALGHRLRNDRYGVVLQSKFLEFLRGLAAAYPDDGVVRAKFAFALFQTVWDADSTHDIARRDPLVCEFGTILSEHLEYPAKVWAQFAEGFGRIFIAASNNWWDAPGCHPRADALLSVLRRLAHGHGEIAVVRWHFARGLFNMLHHAQAQGDLGRRDALLDELRALARAHGEDAAVRENLARGLFNTLHHAQAQGDLGRRDALLDELRALARAHGEEALLHAVGQNPDSLRSAD